MRGETGEQEAAFTSSSMLYFTPLFHYRDIDKKIDTNIFILIFNLLFCVLLLLLLPSLSLSPFLLFFPFTDFLLSLSLSSKFCQCSRTCGNINYMQVIYFCLNLSLLTNGLISLPLIFSLLPAFFSLIPPFISINALVCSFYRWASPLYSPSCRFSFPHSFYASYFLS